MNYCPNCGNKVENQKFCDECGQKTAKEVKLSKQQRIRLYHQNKKYDWLVPLLHILISGLGLVYLKEYGLAALSLFGTIFIVILTERLLGQGVIFGILYSLVFLFISCFRVQDYNKKLRIELNLTKKDVGMRGK